MKTARAVVPWVHVGCCGWARGRKRYFQHFSVVEVQQTFYDPPRPETLAGWRREAPSGFVFTLKAWQRITHDPSSPTYRRQRTPLEGPLDHYGFFRPTREVFAAWERTLEAARVLEARWVLFQCPASFRPTESNLEAMRTFFQKIPRDGFRLGWEPRGKWPPEVIQDLCESLDLIHVVDPFQGLPVTRGVAYFRLHGREGYRYQYTGEDLAALDRWCRPYSEVWVLFNNLSMWEDALRFQQRIQKSG